MAHAEPLVELQSFGDLPPFFCVPGIGGHVQQLYRLAAHMGNTRPFHCLPRTAEIRRYRYSQSNGRRLRCCDPSSTAQRGHSTWEATRLERYSPTRWLSASCAGHEIGRLVIIDQRTPGWRLTAREVLPVLHRILAHIPIRLRYELSRLPAAQRFRHVRRLFLRWLKTAIGQPT